MLKMDMEKFMEYVEILMDKEYLDKTRVAFMAGLLLGEIKRTVLHMSLDRSKTMEENVDIQASLYSLFRMIEFELYDLVEENDGEIQEALY